jgi:phosphoribosylaminoimidazole (AIR) synthetase
MGIGMAAVVAPEDAEASLAVLRANGVEAVVIGRIEEGDHSVIFDEA